MRDETRKFRPANGAEGDWFEHEFCAVCVMADVEDGICGIFADAWKNDIDDQEYPKELIYAKDKPTCTAFERKVKTSGLLYHYTCPKCGSKQTHHPDSGMKCPDCEEQRKYKDAMKGTANEQ